MATNTEDAKSTSPSKTSIANGSPPAYTEESPYESTTITFAKPGVVPPVFIAGTLTSPAWSAVEMTFINTASDAAVEPTYTFKADLHNIPVGEHQYKFRLGMGDVWAVDEKHETTRDAIGNNNNVIRFPLSGDESRQVDEDGPKALPTPPSSPEMMPKVVKSRIPRKSSREVSMPSTSAATAVAAAEPESPSTAKPVPRKPSSSVSIPPITAASPVPAAEPEAPATPKPESIPLPATPQTDSKSTEQLTPKASKGTVPRTFSSSSTAIPSTPEVRNAQAVKSQVPAAPKPESIPLPPAPRTDSKATERPSQPKGAGVEDGLEITSKGDTTDKNVAEHVEKEEQEKAVAPTTNLSDGDDKPVAPSTDPEDEVHKSVAPDTTPQDQEDKRSALTISIQTLQQMTIAIFEDWLFQPLARFFEFFTTQPRGGFGRQTAMMALPFLLVLVAWGVGRLAADWLAIGGEDEALVEAAGSVTGL